MEMWKNIAGRKKKESKQRYKQKKDISRDHFTLEYGISMNLKKINLKYLVEIKSWHNTKINNNFILGSMN